MSFLSSLVLLAGTQVACPPAETATPPVRPRIVTGAFRPVDVDDEKVLAAAEFAAGTVDGQISEITSAERQTVAGTNFRLAFTTVDGRSFRADVHQALNRSFQMRSIVEVEGGGDDADGSGNEDE